MAVLTPLTRRPHERDQWRLRPEDGPPRCLIEQLIQLYFTNRLGLYTALVASLALAGIVLLVLEAVFSVKTGSG